MSPRKATLRYWKLNQVKETRMFRQVKKGGRGVSGLNPTLGACGDSRQFGVAHVTWRGVSGGKGVPEKWAHRQRGYTTVLLHLYLKGFLVYIISPCPCFLV